MLQIPYVESRQCKLDMPKMSIALVETLSTSSTFSCLTRDTHVNVHRPIGSKSARVVGGRGEVVDIAVGDFENSLVHDVLIGAARRYYAFCSFCGSGKSYYMPN